MIKANGDPDVKDAALIAAAQRVEHYEIATYGSLRAFALRLGFNQAANLLQQTLQEEAAADERLTQIAESSVNVLASSKAV
jgi:ferritin-like metal-binding protein YciE